MTCDKSLVGRLGQVDLAGVVRTWAPQALVSACDDASEAYQASKYADGFTYGTDRWRFGLGWVADTLAARCPGKVIRLGHLHLALVGDGPGCLIYPVAVGKTAKLDLQTVRIRPSQLRQELLSAPMKDEQLALSFAGSDPADEHSKVVIGEPAHDLEEAGDAEREDAATEGQDLAGLRPAGRVVLLLLYSSNPLNGLLAAAIGEAVMAEDGTLTFLWSERLEVPGTGGGSGLHLAGEALSAPGFAAGDEPELAVTARSQDRAAGGSAGSGPDDGD